MINGIVVFIAFIVGFLMGAAAISIVGYNKEAECTFQEHQINVAKK